jgi:acyl carrier protein
MTDAEILDGIRSVARAHLGHDGPVELDTVLVEALRLDSVRLLTLVAEVENHFAVILEDGDEAGIERVEDLVAVIRRRRGA